MGLRGPKPAASFDEYFWARIEEDENGCWIWQGEINKHGYGVIRWGDYPRTTASHAAYEHLVGPIAEGFEIDHLCRVRSCANPEHLEAVTRRVNHLRGFGPSGINGRKTHCIRGHKFTAENTYISYDHLDNPHRQCRTCWRERARRPIEDPTYGPGLCECGCGQPAPIATKTDRSTNRIKGKPMRFVHGHNGRQPPPDERAALGEPITGNGGAADPTEVANPEAASG